MKNTGIIRSTQEAKYIVEMAPYHDQRTGQLLFNSLKHEIADIVRDTSFDPFYKELTCDEIIDWLENHIIYDDDGNMICLFNGNDILWEKE